jgi:hypothetical protein
MKSVRRRLTYANVMSSIAVFLVVAGGSALAANSLGKNTVGSKQLKKNAVTAAKIKKNAVTGAKVKDQSLTGSDIKLSTLGTVPSAATAATATSATSADSATVSNSVANRFPVKAFTGPGTTPLLSIGTFTISGSCTINNAGVDESELQLTTSVDGAVMDDNSGNEWTPFNTTENPAELIAEDETTGEIGFEAGDGEFVAVAPDGTTIAFENQAVGSYLPGHPGQCFFEFIADKIG